MRIGLTYDLRSEYRALGFGEEEIAEFDREETIEAIERALARLGHETERIGNVQRLVERLAAGRRWDLVFNIAEGLYGVGREAQVPALLDAYRIPYTFSDPLVLSLTLHKAMAKRVVRDARIPTAPFAVVESEEDAARVRFGGPYFVKPVAEGTGKGITARSVVRERRELAAACRRLIEAFRQPALVETFLPGREFTVGLAGTGREARVIATIEIRLLASAEENAYSFANKEHFEERVRYRRLTPAEDPLIAEVEAIALAAWRVLGCRDAGRLDVRCDRRGRPCFLEVNPLAGLHPEHSDLPILCRLAGVSFEQLIAWILESAARRTDAPAAGGGDAGRGRP